VNGDEYDTLHLWMPPLQVNILSFLVDWIFSRKCGKLKTTHCLVRQNPEIQTLRHAEIYKHL
jgi:hypothetical protein